MKLFNFVNSIAMLYLCLVSPAAFAVPESELLDSLSTQILPYVEARAVEGEFNGVGNIKIRYLHVSTENPKGAIVVSHGKGEAAIKYAELIYDMRDWGYDIYVINHRGHGASDRMLADKTLTHVENFADYVDDFAKLIHDRVQPMGYKKLFIFAHSMGGAIVTGFMQKYPNSATGVVLLSPMIQINAGALGETFSLSFTWLASALGFGKSKAPGQNPSVNDVTNSDVRFEAYNQIFALHPELKVSFATMNWVKESLTFTRHLRSGSSKAFFNVPTLLLQAGADQIVMPEGQDEICGSPLENSEVSLFPRSCVSLVVPGAGHEILMEQDSIRDEALKILKNFVTNN